MARLIPVQETPERELGFVPCHVPDSFTDRRTELFVSAASALESLPLVTVDESHPENPRLIGRGLTEAAVGTPSALLSGEWIMRLP